MIMMIIIIIIPIIIALMRCSCADSHATRAPLDLPTYVMYVM